MKNLSPSEYLSSKANFHLIDVRSGLEWDACHEENAVHLPLTELMDGAAGLPKDKPLAFVCRTGGRSARACEMLQNSGLELYNLAGGMRALVMAKKERGLITPEKLAQLMAVL